MGMRAFGVEEEEVEDRDDEAGEEGEVSGKRLYEQEGCIHRSKLCLYSVIPHHIIYHPAHQTSLPILVIRKKKKQSTPRILQTYDSPYPHKTMAWKSGFSGPECL